MFLFVSLIYVFMQENVRKATFKIVIKKVEEPFSSDPFVELDWICQSLGFFEPIDRDKTASAIFKELLQISNKQKAMSSTLLSERLNMSRGSIINHLNNLQRAGLIVRQGRYYYPRSKSISRTIAEIEEDIDRVFQKMKKAAQEIDKEMGVIAEQEWQFLCPFYTRCRQKGKALKYLGKFGVAKTGAVKLLAGESLKDELLKGEMPKTAGKNKFW